MEAELKKIQEAAVFEEPAEPDAPGEVETPEAVATVKAKLEEVEAMLAQERGMNPNVILKNLTEIVPLWPAAESPELSDRLVTAFNTLKTRMSAACAAASREDQEAKLKARRGASTCGFTGQPYAACSLVKALSLQFFRLVQALMAFAHKMDEAQRLARQCRGVLVGHWHAEIVLAISGSILKNNVIAQIGNHVNQSGTP